jgi:predicted phage terminase large subunit-like protein
VLLARSSPGGLALATDANYQYPPHLALIDDAIVEAIAGDAPPRIIVEAPPRHGKSWLCSKWLPAWFVGTFPTKRVLFGAYEADFAAQWGARGRRILEELGGPIFGIGVDDESRARYRWDVKQSWQPGDADAFDWMSGDGGGMMTAGVGGPFTGKGGDLIIIDDPVKNREEAESERYREKIWEWWQSAIYTRLEPGAVAIVIMARWHHDDLAGRLLQAAADGGEEWTRIRLPALAEENDVLGRKPGEALWPERYDEEDFARMRQPGGVGSYAFEGLYQCNPTMKQGDIWLRDWWAYHEGRFLDENGHPFRFDTVIESWDCAFKKKSDTDFVVGQLWGRYKARKFLLAQIRARLSFTETKAAMRALTRWARLREWTPQAVLVEDKANGSAIIDELRSEIDGIVPVEPEASKEARAHAAAPTIEAGQVEIPSGTIPAPPDRQGRWEPTPTHVLVDEAAAFPRGTNDDQVDATSQALRWLSEHGGRAEFAINTTPRGRGGSVTSDLLDRPM